MDAPQKYKCHEQGRKDLVQPGRVDQTLASPKKEPHATEKVIQTKHATLHYSFGPVKCTLHLLPSLPPPLHIYNDVLTPPYILPTSPTLAAMCQAPQGQVPQRAVAVPPQQLGQGDQTLWAQPRPSAAQRKLMKRTGRPSAQTLGLVGNKWSERPGGVGENIGGGSNV